jgi:hypothetical protein
VALRIDTLLVVWDRLIKTGRLSTILAFAMVRSQAVFRQRPDAKKVQQPYDLRVI